MNRQAAASAGIGGGWPRGGEVTVAVSGFPMSNMPVDWFVPAKEALSVRIEEMKLPPLSR